MQISFVGQQKRECLSVTAIRSAQSASLSTLFHIQISSNDQLMMTTWSAALRSALLAKSSASVFVCPRREAFIAQVDPCYLKIMKKYRVKIKTITLLAACTSALLARSRASVSVCPPFEAHIAQVDPSYFKSEIQ